MNYTYLHYQTGLAFLYGLGPRKTRALLDHLPSLEGLFTLSFKELSAITGLKPDFFRQMRREDALMKTEKILEFNKKNDVRSIFFKEAEFSRRLNQCSDAPIQLFIKGNVDLNQARFVAIVGTRSATEYGRKICKELIASFQGNNIIVVSGLALGIDTYVHRYCAEYNIPTIGVLGHGMDRIYPGSNKQLAQKMIDSGGAIITEFAPGIKPDRENFPKRNRIVAGLCDATIVVESKASGGSLITAHIANSYNRDVFAFPGPVYTDTSEGCNVLIASSKAHLLEKPEAFLKAMNWEMNSLPKNQQFQIFPELSELQQEIAGEVGKSQNIALDILASRLALPISSLQVELLQLKINGIIEELPGNRYQIA